MREIEFIGKTIKSGEWKYGDLIKTNGATGANAALISRVIDTKYRAKKYLWKSV